jgi:hypothetical protein
MNVKSMAWIATVVSGNKTTVQYSRDMNVSFRVSTQVS